jgi:hypothetical protein
VSVEWGDNPEIVRSHLTGEDPDLEMFTRLEEEGYTVCAHGLKDADSPLLIEIGEEHPCDNEYICTCNPVFITVEDIEARRKRAEG